MTASLSPNTVGLFGTCGGSRWREPFLKAFEQHGIPFFNPQVENWCPELAEAEAWHLANDQIILFPVTGETFGFGSLAESGFSLRAAMATNSRRFIIFFIAPDVDDALKLASPEQAEASRRARKLVLAHLEQASSPWVFQASSLQNMLDKTLKLYAVLRVLNDLSR